MSTHLRVLVAFLAIHAFASAAHFIVKRFQLPPIERVTHAR
jgi:Kef-type K+ transport system membrane component KefB